MPVQVALVAAAPAVLKVASTCKARQLQLVQLSSGTVPALLVLIAGHNDRVGVVEIVVQEQSLFLGLRTRAVLVQENRA